jgi:hypothetical protein
MSVSQQIQSALPICVPALVTFVFSSLFTWSVRSNVVRLRKTETTSTLIGDQPDDFADMAIWAVDQYQLLLLVVISPILGVFFGHTTRLSIAVIIYVCCEVLTFGLYLIVVGQENASMYISKFELRSVPIIRHIARLAPFLGRISMTAVIPALIYLIGGVTIARFAT